MKLKSLFLPLLLIAGILQLKADDDTQWHSFTIYDHYSYYDGYLVDKIPEDAPSAEGVTRLYTYLATTPLSDDLLDALGSRLHLDVTLTAVCDNYDRIANVNLAFIPKGQKTYTVTYEPDADPMRFEIARFITPFMDKNKEPREVPYTWNISYLSNLLRDTALREKYDFWLELEIFGVPYAANKEIAGCADCNEVFQGSLQLRTSADPAGPASGTVVAPLVIRKGDWCGDRGMNNYNDKCTDELGKTVKTWKYDVAEACSDSRVVLLMSNHGAGTNGEEYVRRQHMAWLDAPADADFSALEPALTWKPGGESCEPFRKYNTQGNGIYSYFRSESFWKSYSNWCPGAAIPTRFLETGAVTAGGHSVRIEVPKAQFYGKDGYFPVSMYFIGVKSGRLDPSADIDGIISDAEPQSGWTLSFPVLTVTSRREIASAELCSPAGQIVASAEIAPGAGAATFDVAEMPRGVYVICVTLRDGTREAHRMVL